MSRVKKDLKIVLVDPQNRYYFLVSDFLALVTVVSIIAIVFETVPALQPFMSWFVAIEWITVSIFTIEYFWRLWLSERKWGYVFSWFGLIDLIAILPTFIGLGNWTFLKSARIVRLVRLLRLMRLAKLHNVRHHPPDEQLSFYTVNILLFLTILLGATLLIGMLIYLVEGQYESFASIPHGMWWAFRIFTNDPTFVRTNTIGGEVVYILARLVGLIVFGALVGILGNVLKTAVLGENKERRQ